MPLALQDKNGFFSVVDEDAIKKCITDTYETYDMWTVEYLITKILGEATTDQLSFIQDAISGRV